MENSKAKETPGSDWKPRAGYTKSMTLWEFASETSDKKFSIGNSKVVWESAVAKNNGKVRVSRICETGGRPFLMGLRYKSQLVDGSKIVFLKE